MEKLVINFPNQLRESLVIAANAVVTAPAHPIHNIVLAGCPDSPYVKPTQLGILTKRYPLVRGLFYILKENYNGLGAGFVDFMQFERGQLIFKRAYLGSKMGFAIRDVKINEKLVK